MIEYLSLSGYTIQQKVWLCAGFLLAAASLFCLFREKNRWPIILLTLGGLCLFVFAAISDPFLHFWDERFHALVAQNCMNEPFSPKLYREWPVEHSLPNGSWDQTRWDHGYIWLHKQPLFIWQIALCFKLFGVSLFTLRLPSVIMGTLMIPIMYRIGSLLVDRRLGYFAALSTAFSWFLLNLVSGNGTVDHNNVCFIFYVTASLWAWMEYIRSGRKWRWVFAIALLSSCAILTKWLVGLLVYAAWGIYTLSEYRFQLRQWKIVHMVAALAITIVLVLPWQIYTRHAFPKYYAVEHELNRLHLTDEVEGHEHSSTFHLKSVPYLYIGDCNYRDYLSEDTSALDAKRIFHLLLVVAGLGLLLWRCRKWSHRITIFSLVLLVYAFFSIAATKMPAYPFCICAIGFLALAMLPYELWRLGDKLLHNPWVRGTVLLTITAVFALYQMNLGWMRHHHTPVVGYWTCSSHNMGEISKLDKMLPPNTLLFNCRGSKDWGFYCTSIEAMFFSKSLCYPFPPSEADFLKAKAAGYHIAINTAHEVPDYMLNDPDVQFIELDLWEDY